MPSKQREDTHRTASPPADRSAEEPGAWWRRGEDVRLVTGQGEFVADVTCPGELSMRIVRSPLAHGVIRSIDTTRARAMPGVALILTGEDLGSVPTIPLRVRSSPELDAFLQPVLAVGKVRYVGEPVAFVIAETARQAEDAADVVDIDIERLEPVVDVLQASADPVWAEVHDGHLCTARGFSGDFEKLAATAHLVVTEEFETARDTGLPLETRGLLAEWNEDRSQLQVWGPTKFVKFTRATLANWFDVQSTDVVCHHVDVGGMFGTRGELYPEDYLVPFAARELGRPVKWIEDRNEHLVSINHSRGQKHAISVAVAEDGTLLAMKDEIWLDLGAYARPIGGRLIELPVEAMPGPYRWSGIDIVCHGVTTNKTPTGAMRGPATFDAGFVRERMMDIVADRLGMDPLDLRMHNLIRAEEVPYRQEFGPSMHASIYDSGDFKLVVNELLDQTGGRELRAEVQRRRAAGELVGYGFGFFLAHSGLGIEESIKIELGREGRFEILTTASEIGQGLATMLRIVAGDALGVEHARIDVTTNSTDRFDGGNGTYSARSTIFAGSAALDAATQLRDALRRHNPSADPADPDSWLPIAPHAAIGTHRAEQPVFGFGVQVAVVSLNVDTLHPTVERIAVGYDCGKAIDPVSLHGQIVGAAVQGVGGALLQQLVFDDQGQPQSTTFMDYLVPTVYESPHVDVVLLELPGTTSNPLGVKGGGEAGIMGAGGAVANAVADALSAPSSIRKLPIGSGAILPFVEPVRGQRPPPRGEADRTVDPSPETAVTNYLGMALVGLGVLALGICTRSLVRRLRTAAQHDR